MRKRTSKTIPAKGRLRDIADRLWSNAVLRIWDRRCAVCGKRATDAHHLIPRANYLFRYLTMNGIALCSWDHLWNPRSAPHANAAGWLRFLEANHCAKAEWYKASCDEQFDGIANAAYYLAAIQSFRSIVPEFESIVGKKLALHLTTLQ